jgi:membrane protein DedA with SNARE-associated domain
VSTDPAPAELATVGPATATELHPHDRVPESLRRVQERLLSLWPTSRRRQAGAVVAIVAVLVATAIAASHLLRFVLQGLDLFAYLGLFVVNWIGAGGLLVPIPGIRIAGWLMIIQQGGSLDPLAAGLVGGLAMALGQISFYAAARTSAGRASAHHTESLGRRKRLAAAKDRVEDLVRRHGFATILGLSLVPNPLTTLACASAGALGMGFRRFAAATLVGRVVLGLVLAYLGQAIFEFLFPSLLTS